MIVKKTTTGENRKIRQLINLVFGETFRMIPLFRQTRLPYCSHMDTPAFEQRITQVREKFLKEMDNSSKMRPLNFDLADFLKYWQK